MIIKKSLIYLYFAILTFIAACSPEPSSDFFAHYRLNSPEIRIQWTESDDNVYVTVGSDDNINPKKIYPGQNRILPAETNIKPPFQLQGFKEVRTYLLRERISERIKMKMTGGAPEIFIIGEIHFGRSQRHVARHLLDLIQRYEIDAVFVEQPDNLQYDWSVYQVFEKHPRRAIAAIYAQFLKDAEFELKEPDFGPYAPYFQNIKTEDDLTNALDQIAEDKGKQALIDATILIQKIYDEINNIDQLYQAYERSEYISAADYLYIMLNLQGIHMPFYNIESRQLRKEFEEKLKAASEASDLKDKDLEPRDNYMAEKLTMIVKAKGYNKAILICGARHIPNLPNQIRDGYGLGVQIVYNSFEKEIKAKMAVLVNPPYVKSLVDNYNGTASPKPAPVLDQTPSEEMIGQITQFLKRHPATGVEVQDAVVSFRHEFQVSKSNLRGKDEWHLSVPLAGGQEMRVSRTPDTGELIISLIRKIDAKNAPKSENLGIDRYQPNAEEQRILQQYEKDNPRLRTMIIENKDTHYEVHTAQGKVYEVRHLRNILDQIVAEMDKSTSLDGIVLDMKGFPPSKDSTWVANSMAMSKSRYPNLHIIPILKSSFGKILLSKGTIKLAGEPKVTIAKIGRFFKVTAEFIVTIGQNIYHFVVDFFVPNRQIADGVAEQFRILEQRAGTNGVFARETSLLSLIQALRVKAAKEMDMSADEFEIQIKMQLEKTETADREPRLIFIGFLLQ